MMSEEVARRRRRQWLQKRLMGAPGQRRGLFEEHGQWECQCAGQLGGLVYAACVITAGCEASLRTRPA